MEHHQELLKIGNQRVPQHTAWLVAGMDMVFTQRNRLGGLRRWLPSPASKVRMAPTTLKLKCVTKALQSEAWYDLGTGTGWNFAQDQKISEDHIEIPGLWWSKGFMLR
jgi:hypothetical protein